MASRRVSRDESLLGEGALAGFARWREAMRWQRAIDRELRPLGLTHTRLLVLSALDHAVRQADEGVSEADVSRTAGLDHVTTGAVLRALEARGFVDRDVGFGDKRSWRIVPTRSGERVLRRAAALVEDVSVRIDR